jgi:rod shape-determining protein MreB
MGAKLVIIEEEAKMAALEAGINIDLPQGNLVIDIGGGTTEIAVISLSHIVIHNSIRVGGDKMDTEIMSYLKKKNSLLVGIQLAEKLKKEIGSASTCTQ